MKRRIYCTKVSIDTLVLVDAPGDFEDKMSAGSGKTGAKITRQPTSKYKVQSPGVAHSPCLEDPPERNEMKNEIRTVVNALPGTVWTASLEGPLPWLKLSA